MLEEELTMLLPIKLRRSLNKTLNIHFLFFRLNVDEFVFFKWDIPGLFFVYFRLFLQQVQLLKNLAASGIRTRIFGAVGENADHYTTTTALNVDEFTIVFPWNSGSQPTNSL